jgi:hypothetical protein
MFSLPQPDASVSVKQSPVIDLTENSKTVAVLLTLIYPVVSVATEPETLDEIGDALVAAKKYEMAAVSQRLNQKFTESKVVQDDPIVAFCAAYSRKLGALAHAAAKASLKRQMNLDIIEDQLENINGPAFHKLYKFHRACSAVAVQAVSGSHLTWITRSNSAWWDFANPGNCGCQRHQYTLPANPGSGTRITWHGSAPYHDFITRSNKVLKEHPCREALSDSEYHRLSPSHKEIVCTYCRISLLGLPEFSYLLGEEVERRVSMVRYYIFP